MPRNLLLGSITSFAAALALSSCSSSPAATGEAKSKSPAVLVDGAVVERMSSHVNYVPFDDPAAFARDNAVAFRGHVVDLAAGPSLLIPNDGGTFSRNSVVLQVEVSEVFRGGGRIQAGGRAFVAIQRGGCGLKPNSRECVADAYPSVGEVGEAIPPRAEVVVIASPVEHDDPRDSGSTYVDFGAGRPAGATLYGGAFPQSVVFDSPDGTLEHWFGHTFDSLVEALENLP